MTRSSRTLVGLLVLTCVSVSPGPAGAQDPPESPAWQALGRSLSGVWTATPGCAHLSVERLAPSRGLLQILTSDAGLVIHVAAGERPGMCHVGQDFTVFAGHGASESTASCVDAVCRALLAAPGVSNSLARELATSERWSEPPPPQVAPSPEPEPRDVLQGSGLLLWCLVALMLPVALSLRGWRRRDGDGPSVGGDAWWIGVLVVGAVALRAGLAWRLGVRPDELLDWGRPDLWGDLAGVEASMNPPLYRVLTAPLAWLTAGDPLWARVGPVAIGGLTTGVAARFGQLVADRRGGLAAGAFIALHPLAALAGAFHRPYALLLLWTLLAAITLERALRSKGSEDKWLAASFAGGLPLVHYFGVGPLAGLALWWLTDPRARPIRGWWGPIALVVGLVLPLVPLMLAGGLDKGADPTGYAGAAHAWRLLETAPATLGGFVMPPLEAPVYAEYASGVAFDSTVAGLLVLAAFLACTGLVRWAGAAITLGAATVPLLAGFVLTGIRDFQLVAALAGIALLTAGAARRPWGPLVVAGLVTMSGLCVVRDWPDQETSRYEPAIEWVGMQGEGWPVHVWPYPAVHEIAYHAGGSRAAADGLTSVGVEPVRPLGRCSATGVRELLTTRASARLLLLDDSCTEPIIEDGEVMCEAISAPPGAVALDCAIVEEVSP